MVLFKSLLINYHYLVNTLITFVNILIYVVLNCLDSSRRYGRLLENPKTGGFRELCLPENDFKTCSTVRFSKKYMDFWSLGTNQGEEFRLELFSHVFLHMNSV